MRPADEAPKPVLGPVRAALIAFGALLVANAVALSVGDTNAQALRVRGLQHAYQAGRHLGLALVVVALLALAPHARLHGRRAYLVLALLALLLAATTLQEDLDNFAGTLLPAAPGLALWALTVVAALGIVLAALVGKLLGRPRRQPARSWQRWLPALRWLPVLTGLGVLLVHPFMLETGYPGVHLFAAAAALALITGALTSAPLPRQWPHIARATPWALAGAIALFTFLVAPSNSLQLQMLQQEGDIVTPFLSRLPSFGDEGEGAVPKAWAPWFAQRDAHPPIPASTPPLFADKAPIVLLITIDSLRADILASKKHDKELKHLAALRNESLDFTMARAPGSQTVYTLAELFMGKYFSQQYWTNTKEFKGVFPFEDTTPRFPQLLTEAGIPTLNLATTGWLVNGAGIANGFADDRFVTPVSTRYTLSAQTFPVLIERLGTVGDGPFFAYTHMLDAHYTISPLAKKSPAKKRYTANLKLVDDSIGQLLEAIDRLGIADRTTLIISSDHGEAFGEHNTHHHRYTIYEELLRVPLLIRSPGVKPRKIDVPVSVIDIGATILDLFGQPTPGYHMGQSLLGFLRGENPKLTRPIAAEGRLKKSLVFPDGLKAIIDDRHKTSEVYNLKSDPGELINLLDADDPRAAERIKTVRTFFDVHKLTRDGYKVPFRP